MKPNLLYRTEDARRDWPFPSYPSLFNVHAVRIIGFCGNIYPMIELVDYDDLRGRAPAPVKCFSIADVDAFARITNDRGFKNYHGKNKRSGWCRHRSDRKDFLRFFDECRMEKASYRSMFEDRMCPVFVATEAGIHCRNTPNIVYNALLNSHEFFRVFDTYAAFQEIEMFLSNMAVPQKPMPAVSNELKIHSRGFNQWSFRKPPAGQ